MQTASSRCGRLTAATALLWLVLAGPAYLLSGTDGLEGLSYSALLCLVPGWLVFWGVSRYRVPNVQALAVLAGTGMRLVFVLVGVLTIQSFRPQLQFREFQLWIILCYLATLAVETWLLLKQPPSE